MDGNTDIEEMSEGTTKFGRMHFGISVWTLFILYVKVQQRKDWLWNVVSCKLEKFLWRQSEGSIRAILINWRTKCWLLSASNWKTSSSWPHKNGLNMIEGKELTFDIVLLGKNGLNIPRSIRRFCYQRISLTKCAWLMKVHARLLKPPMKVIRNVAPNSLLSMTDT